MPVYDFKCTTCETVVERSVPYELREHTTCLECGDRMLVLPVLMTNTHSVLPAGMFEDITDKPLQIDNKQQLRDACKEHGCYATGLID